MLELKRRDNDKKVIAVKMEMADMMAILLERVFSYQVSVELNLFLNAMLDFATSKILICLVRTGPLCRAVLSA
jgi:hypothetical protein